MIMAAAAAKRPTARHHCRPSIAITLAIIISIVFSLCSFPKCVVGLSTSAFSFSRPSLLTRSSHPLHPSGRYRYSPSRTTLLYGQTSGNNSFDISKPTFDLLSFRLIRSDALLRYNSLNQSEPLRINLYLLATVTLLGYPLWCESVTGDVATTISIVGSTLSGFGSAALFWRERARRSNQLNRMEKEMNAEDLEVRIPVNTAISSARPTSRLKDLRSKRRILAIRGSREQLSGLVWDTLCVLRRRLVQSKTLVVLVPTDGSQKEDWGWDTNQLGNNALWLADPLNVDGEGGWISYFSELLASNNDALAWFALNFKGRSIASALGEAPRLLELLGQQLQPMELLDETDAAEFPEDNQVAAQILECQKKFYGILTDSSINNEMKAVFTTRPADEVNEVVNGGGRIDGWDLCLEPGARPTGMVIASSDVWVASDSLAYSTCVEFPPNAGVDGATLLAVQRWGREMPGDEEWKLELHQTIPWSVGSSAGGTLRCDCRGCVALARTQEKRTFGGLIG